MPLITPATARAMSAKAAESRRRNREEYRALRQAKETIQPELHPALANQYVTRQLARTRKQIDLLNDMLEGPLDWKALKAVADAKARLYEIEAALADRPKPGSRRPGRDRSPKGTTKPSSYGKPTQ